MGTCTAFEHTADLGLRITGSDLDDLFRTAAEGLLDTILTNREAIRPEASESFELRAEAPEELLVAWLNELIFRLESSHRVYGRFDVRVAEDGRSLRATIEGEPIDRARHELDHEVKAVTHHGLRLDRAEDGTGWVAEVILDI